MSATMVRPPPVSIFVALPASVAVGLLGLADSIPVLGHVVSRLVGEMAGDLGLHRGAERKTGQHRCRYRMKRAEFALRIFERREQVVALAAPLVIRAFARPDAAKIRPQREISEPGQSVSQGLHHLVVERPAIERMRVGHQRETAHLSRGRIDGAFDSSGGAWNQLAPRLDATHTGK